MLTIDGAVAKVTGVQLRTLEHAMYVAGREGMCVATSH